MIKAQIGDMFLFGSDRMALRIVQRDTDETMVRRLGILSEHEIYGHVLRYEDAQEADAWGQYKPTMALTETEAFALYRCLEERFRSHTPAKDARADLEHERGRVDKLTDALIQNGAALLEMARDVTYPTDE